MKLFRNCNAAIETRGTWDFLRHFFTAILERVWPWSSPKFIGLYPIKSMPNFGVYPIDRAHYWNHWEVGGGSSKIIWGHVGKFQKGKWGFSSWIYLSGWWYTYPSEKYEFVSGDDDIPNWMESHKNQVPNHQPAILCKQDLGASCNGWKTRFLEIALW